jgi:peptidoglycan hydrolase CwlO-like protein
VDIGVATIVGALIAGFATLFQQQVAGRKENRADHGKVQEKLDSLKDSVDRVENKVDKVEDKIDDHITDHARGTV